MYTESKLHSYCISTSDSVSLIRQALKSGQRISCSVAAANLLFTDESLVDFDTHFKVMPPLRNDSDRKALIKGVIDGSVQCICANHEPLEEECKKLEFANAEFGSTGLQTAFAMANTALEGKLEIEDIINCFNYGPREILGLPKRTISEGAVAELTLFDPSTEWIPTRDTLKSKSKNSAALGVSLTGKVIGTVNRGQFFS